MLELPSNMGEEDFSVLHAISNGTDRVAKVNGSGTTAFPGLGLNPRSCVTCRRRKVKCDKREPCSNCTKASIECIFPSPGRAPRKARRPPDNELIERLRKLESVVQNLGPVEEPAVRSEDETIEERENFQQRHLRKVANAPGTQQEKGISPGGFSSSEDRHVDGLDNKFGRLVVSEGKSRYINSSFWANLSTEVEDLKQILKEDSEDDEDFPSPSAATSSNHQNFIFGFASSNMDMSLLHPAPEHVAKYWSYFKENVDPLAKILHIPTMEPVILASARSLTTLTRPLECLSFAVYYGCITSLEPDECLQEFGETKETLLSRYRFGIEQALARASFLDSQEMAVLQAFVIYLVLLRRNDEATIIWTLTGLIVRIAQTLGLHRDGTHFNLRPFEIEMRRRLWWQICILDARASEDHGCDPSITEAQFDTQMPLNVNDADLRPEMKELPESRKGFTEMTFCLIRFEVANIFRRISYVPPGPVKCTTFFANLSVQEKEKWIADTHQRLEETYLNHCDLTVPLYWVTATVSRLVLSKMWLVIYHPFQRLDGGASLPQEIRDKLFVTSLESVEYSILLETEKRTKRWEWLFKTYIQWHSLAFMLSELCIRTQGEVVERAWRAIEASIALRFPGPVNMQRKGALWRPLRKLMYKARAARERALAQERADVHASARADGFDTSPTVCALAAPLESYPAFDALLSRGSMQWDSPPTNNKRTPSDTSPDTIGTSVQQPNPDIAPQTNQEAQDFMARSNMGMDWLASDLLKDYNTETALDWANWDDMVRQYGMNTEIPGTDAVNFDSTLPSFHMTTEGLANDDSNDLNSMNGTATNGFGGTGNTGLNAANATITGVEWF